MQTAKHKNGIGSTLNFSHRFLPGPKNSLHRCYTYHDTLTLASQATTE